MKDVLRAQQPDLRPWAEKHPELASQLNEKGFLSAKTDLASESKSQPEPEPELQPEEEPEQNPEPLPERQSAPMLVTVAGVDMGTTQSSRADGEALDQGLETTAASPPPPTVAVVGDPSFIGIPIPQALFHPPPNGPC